MEINGGSIALYLARSPRVPLFMLVLVVTKTGSTPTPWETEIQTMVLDHGLRLNLFKSFLLVKDRHWTSLSCWSEIRESQGEGVGVDPFTVK